MTEADVMQFPSMHYLRAFADVSGENQGNNWNRFAWNCTFLFRLRFLSLHFNWVWEPPLNSFAEMVRFCYKVLISQHFGKRFVFDSCIASSISSNIHTWFPNNSFFSSFFGNFFWSEALAENRWRRKAKKFRANRLSASVFLSFFCRMKNFELNYVIGSWMEVEYLVSGKEGERGEIRLAFHFGIS